MAKCDTKRDNSHKRIKRFSTNCEIHYTQYNSHKIYNRGNITENMIFTLVLLCLIIIDNFLLCLAIIVLCFTIFDNCVIMF